MLDFVIKKKKIVLFQSCSLYFVKREVPRELIRNSRGGEVNLNMEDHREHEYVKPKVSTRAFTGAGHTLGR